MIQESNRYWALFIRLFFPEQRKWVARILIVAGISMVTGPMWEPYAKAALEHYAGFSVPAIDVTTGWVILILGLAVFSINEVLDRRPNIKVASDQDVADRKSMEILLSNLYLPALDKFFHFGKLSMVYAPVLHYFYGLDGFVQASKYHVHDTQLKDEVDGLYVGLSRALSLGEYFVEMPNEELLKFDSRRDIYVDPDAKRAHEDFVNAVCAAENRLRGLCRLVSSKYPDFDFQATDRAALAEYLQKKEEAEAATVSDFEFSVLSVIVDVETGPAYPRLSTLATLLDCPQVDVQVALDKLIERNFVAHLYRGMPHQKYTVLKEGRAYFVAHGR